MKMRKVGITQRTSIRSGQSQIYDSLDQQWVKFLQNCGLCPVIVPNLIDEIKDYAEEINLSGFILSGGGDFSNIVEKNNRIKDIKNDPNLFSSERDILEFKIIEHCHSKNIPLLGVCRGMQMLNFYYGGKLELIIGHSGNMRKLENLQSEYKFDEFVNSYHEKAILYETLSREFIPLASSENVIKSFKHKKLPQLGIMWHPERNNPFSNNDINLFGKFFR